MKFGAVTLLVLALLLRRCVVGFLGVEDCGLLDYDDDGGDRDSARNRIVNGYIVRRHRPWMVRIARLKKKSLPKDERVDERPAGVAVTPDANDTSRKTGSERVKTFCGGSIITTWFVLTAGHCFCANEYDTKLGQPDVIPCTNKTLGRVKELTGENAAKIRVFLGSLSVDTREVGAGLPVQKVIVHRNMRMVEPWGDDIALVKMADELKFGPSVGAICLPRPWTKDTYREVWVAGWGTVRAKSLSGKPVGCTTTPYGPQKFKQCANYQDKKGKVFCNKAQPPPMDKKCDEFLETFGNSTAFDIAQITQNTSCYLKNRYNRHGWCYTKKPQEAGFYDWGFCMQACAYSYKHKSNTNLREVKLNLLDPNICADKKELDSKRELCVGKEWKKPVVGLFVKAQVTGTYEMTNRTSGTAKFRFIGYHDSCQGDSGGPYYAYDEDERGRTRAVVLGIVSRGNGCAEKNEPGKATRVKLFLDWLDWEYLRDRYLTLKNLSDCHDSELEEVFRRDSPFLQQRWRPHTTRSTPPGHMETTDTSEEVDTDELERLRTRRPKVPTDSVEEDRGSEERDSRERTRKKSTRPLGGSSGEARKTTIPKSKEKSDERKSVERKEQKSTTPKAREASEASTTEVTKQKGTTAGYNLIGYLPRSPNRDRQQQNSRVKSRILKGRPFKKSPRLSRVPSEALSGSEPAASSPIRRPAAAPVPMTAGKKQFLLKFVSGPSSYAAAVPSSAGTWMAAYEYQSGGGQDEDYAEGGEDGGGHVGEKDGGAGRVSDRDFHFGVFENGRRLTIQ